jgi:hypothetical protein
MRETGTGQQVAQLHDRYMMTMTNFTEVVGWIFKIYFNFYVLLKVHLGIILVND